MDLNAPLGTRRPAAKTGSIPLVAGVLAALLFVGAALYLGRADPHGGEPYAMAPIPPAAAPVDPTPTGSIAASPVALANRDVPRVEGGFQILKPGQSGPVAGSSGPLVIDVSKALDEAAHHHRSSSGQDVPVPGASTPIPPPSTPRPRVAIFISGLGLDQKATQTAIVTLPPAVTLAFLPYGDAIARAVSLARGRGHEVLLQLPMQNANGSTPGPHALQAGESESAVDADLDWLWHQFDGFDGVTNLLGAPVTRDRPVLSRILGKVGRQGLFYLDDGTARGSLARELAPTLGATALRADVVLDATNDPAVIQANLERLVVLAKAKGGAIGMASGFPDHLATIARFAADLDAQGVSLVPVSAMANEGARLATSR